MADESSKEIALFSPAQDDDCGGDPLDGILLPTFFMLRENLGIVALITGIKEEFISISVPYKVEMVRDKDGLHTRLRLFYPKPNINIYKANIVYDASPIDSVEYRYINTLLSERRRDFERALYDGGFDQPSNLEYYKQRKIELENLPVK